MRAGFSRVSTSTVATPDRVQPIARVTDEESIPMPVTALHCATCGAGFVDSRPTLADGDEAKCPTCGARNAFTPTFADAVRRGDTGIDTSARIVHSELELKRQD